MADDPDLVLKEGVLHKYQLSRKDQIKLFIAYWLIGLCNNVGYVVALTAAHDLLKEITDHKDSAEDIELKKSFKRDCNVIGTGAILLADIVPSIFIKVIAPFFPLMVKIRFIIIIGLNIAGFLMCAFGFYSMETSWIGIIGVICISLSSGFGESTSLAYTAFYPTMNALAAWSSGTGGAGIIGALMYALLRELGFSSRASMIAMLIWPIVEAIAFYIILPHPKIDKKQFHLTKLEERRSKKRQGDEIPQIEDPHTFKAKLLIFKSILIVYSLPFALTYLFEYFINQALFELLYFPGAFIEKSSQYRWYQFSYQVGVFISRTSIVLFSIPYIYLLAALQFLNVIIFLLEALLGYLHFVMICILLVVWEGLMGGASYVNTYARITSEVPPLQRQFAMSMNSLGDAVAITLAGVIAIPAHSYLCTFENPYEARAKGSSS